MRKGLCMCACASVSEPRAMVGQSRVFVPTLVDTNLVSMRTRTDTMRIHTPGRRGHWATRSMQYIPSHPPHCLVAPQQVPPRMPDCPGSHLIAVCVHTCVCVVSVYISTCVCARAVRLDTNVAQALPCKKMMWMSVTLLGYHRKE